MKILHTSDWHLGQMLYNYDRTEEHRAMLSQMVALAREHRPDAFLLSGDVYHTSSPSSAVQQMFVEAMMQLREAVPDMVIVVTAGNHDSPSRHEVFRLPWKEMGVHMIGTVAPDNLDANIITLPGKGTIVALPYLPNLNPQLSTLNSQLSTFNSPLPAVLMAHTTVEGCDYTGHDALGERTIGGIDSIPISTFGDGFDYIALGHIHKAQDIAPSVRYCGSPLAVSFDERYDHSVTLVEVGSHHSPLTIHHIALTTPRPLVTLPTDGFAPWDEALAALAAFPDDIPAYIRLNVEVDDFLPPEATADAQAAVRDKICRFCCINARRRLKEQVSEKGFTIAEFRDEAPIDIARRYATDKGIAFGDDLEDLFNQAIQSL
jgi:exonuclease SbcD